MQTLYKRFVLLGLFFVFATVTLHWAVWTRSDGGPTFPWVDSNSFPRLRERVSHLSPPLPDERGTRRGGERRGLDAAKGMQGWPRAGNADEEKVFSEKRFAVGQRTDLKSGLSQFLDSNELQKEKSADKVRSNIPKLPFIYETESTFDRIPEQMAFIPASVSGGQGEVRQRIIAVESSPESWNVHRGSKTFHEHKCPVRSCNLIDASAIPSGTTVDAVLFRQEAAVSIKYLQPHRSPDTVYIIFALESPMATRSFQGFEGVFNWTATYRRQSTMVAPYERWRTFPDRPLPANASRNYARGKSKGAAMFVSNCGASNGRLEVARELAKHYPVDIYGACGDKHCSRFDKKCFELLNEDYRFYLAFENANCRDYITEKFFVNGLGNDVIPIVMGAHPDDYRLSSPPHSYIHVEDFPDVKSLADYLKKLEENEDLYNAYFRWKGTGEFMDTKFWCRLCAMVSDDNKPRLVVKNLEEWWRGESVCRTTRWLS